MLGASLKPRLLWDDLTEADWLYGVATRFSLVDGHRVHYKTPTAELAAELEKRAEPEALRHLAQAQMELGERARGLSSMEKWAAAWAASDATNPGAGWEEAAVWAWSFGEHEKAFRFADRAMPGLKGDAQRNLANLRVEWAGLQPTLRDPRALQREALELNAVDWATAYAWVERDISAAKLADAETGFNNLPKSTPGEPALVLKAKLRSAQGRAAEVLPELDAALDQRVGRGRQFSGVFARVVDEVAKARPDEWRHKLSTSYDRVATIRLFTYFKGRDRGDACLGLLQQIDRRYQKDRRDPVFRNRRRAGSVSVANGRGHVRR